MKFKSVWRELLLKSKCSWRQSTPEVMTSSETSSSEAEDHHKLKFIRRCKLKAWKAIQWIHYRLSIAKEWKSEATTILKGFEGIGCLFFEKRWQSTIVRSVQPLSPLLCLCLQQDKNNSYACTSVPSDLEWIWNWSFVGQ